MELWRTVHGTDHAVSLGRWRLKSGNTNSCCREDFAPHKCPIGIAHSSLSRGIEQRFPQQRLKQDDGESRAAAVWRIQAGCSFPVGGDASSNVHYVVVYCEISNRPVGT